MNRERCPRDGKALNNAGECYHCGKSYPAMVGTPMTRSEVRELVREVRQRPPLSPKCRGRLHHLCQMKGCGCPHHERQAAALRREAAQVEHENTEPDAAEHAEHLRRRADEVES
jgi:hypothetical protein